MGTERGQPRRWEIVTTREFSTWLRGLDPERPLQVRAALQRVAAAGPTLGRPRVDSIKGSRIHNLKELRVGRGTRVLFVFGPRQKAVMLVGGDKTGSWNRWYPTNIRRAGRAYDQYLRDNGRGDGWGRAPSGRSR